MYSRVITVTVPGRVPEGHKPVLVARPSEKGQPLKVEQGTYEINGWWRVYGTRVKRVSYWMPMPERRRRPNDERIH